MLVGTWLVVVSIWGGLRTRDSVRVVRVFVCVCVCIAVFADEDGLLLVERRVGWLAGWRWMGTMRDLMMMLLLLLLLMMMIDGDRVTGGVGIETARVDKYTKRQKSRPFRGARLAVPVWLFGHTRRAGRAGGAEGGTPSTRNSGPACRATKWSLANFRF